ncbi:MAG: efflux RND transporter periplasmic adaptor subunit [Alphaproteobacteria bacterium]|nr:efflux RND transporter periplasmic adaptor subunit [Alphaproteobacteria bacterium]
MNTAAEATEDVLSTRSPAGRLAVLFLACLALSPATAAAQGQNGATAVRVDTVVMEPLSQTVPVIGRLVARQAGVVAARINGPIEEFMVEVGDRVEAGDVIAILNRDLLTARRDLAASELQEALAKMATKSAGLALAQQEKKRIEGLKSSAAFNKSRAEDVEQEVAIAKAEMQESEANAATYRSELRLAEINLSYAEVRARYAGVVTRRHAEAGSYVQVGDPVVSMVADESLEIEADVPYQRLAGLVPGTLTRFTLDDGSEHWAIVRAVVPTENPLTRTRAVRFIPEFGETERPLANEQSVTVSVPLGAPRDVLTVHKDAIIKRGGQSIVYVVQNGSAELRPIRLGEAVGSRLEVLDGLGDGDVVVVRGNERLRPGDKVTIDGQT